MTPAQLGDTYWVGLVDPGKSDVITEAFTGTQGVEAVKNQMQYLEPLFSALTIATYIAVGIAVLMLIVSAIIWAIASSTGNAHAATKARLGAWVALGAAFYFNRASELNAIPHEQMQYLLLGTKDRPLLFEAAQSTSAGMNK